jgi:hypothetical protein
MDTQAKFNKGQSNLLAFIVLVVILGSVWVLWIGLAPVASEKMPEMQSKLAFSNSKLQNVSNKGMTNSTGVFMNLPYGLLLIVFIIILYAVFTPT